MSSEKIIEILERNSVIITGEEADFFTGFLNNISELAIKIDDLRILQKTVLDFAETSTYLNISPSHLYKLTSQKLIPHFCPQGKKLYFKRDELDTWLLRNKKYSKEEIENEAINYIIRNRRK